ncbi:hypothetical protein [Hyphococcus luteus]|uniref:Lipoprotein n=1 Tax=Hyphococcus luteus TaxID=2058213 RepID=A0A2S7K606_9PROT|nr:hypothetical protein [Marinicaulis flavus]PQA87927.1 hypothetical protein CW354_06170 [Marinicaulis flavus]
MRSLPILKAAIAGLAASFLAGCLVSEEPVLDAGNGRAAPLDEGVYAACENAEDENAEDAQDCTVFTVTLSDDGAYALAAEDEDEPAQLRFRRVARKAYAVQSAEDDGYAYYYGAGDSDRFELTLMMCDALPEKLRARLVQKGDLSSDDEDFEVCTVKTLSGLVAAAQAYRRGKTTGDDDAKLVLTPVTNEAEE